MDLPKPPADVEAKNIIDKLAQFVARNGAEFEQMTKEKQQGNAKFAFLFGGEFFNYYQYRVTSEQAILKIKGNQHQQQEAPPPPSIEPQHPKDNKPAVWLTNTQPVIQPQPQPTVTVEQLTQQQSTLNEQIHQSESNLKAQHEVLKLQEDAKVDETIKKTQLASFTEEANSLSLSLETLDSMLQPIMDTCTKDSISSGKAWILQHAIDEKSNNFFSKYLLFKVLNASSFTHKLHIIYLVNDILHHCVRKNVPELKKSVEDVVVPMFCNVAKDTNDEQQAKLNKLLTLWESKNHYFAGDIVDKLKEPRRSWFEYRRTLLNTYSIVLTPILALTKATYSNYQSQHEAFVQHAIAQIQTLEEQKTTLLQQKALATMMNVLPAAVTQNAVNNLPSFSNLVSQPQPQAEAQKPPDSMPPLPGGPPPSNTVFHQPPPAHYFPPADLQLPDFSRPPPGFGPPNIMGPGGGGQGPAPPPPAEIQREDLMPSLPYYDLPAGLMVPLIKLEDSNYKPLDRKKIRLPPPTPPSDRLIQAVKAFYAPPGHDSPRDSEGWEKLGLYEYYRAKSCAKRQKEEEIESGRRERSPPPSPVIREKTKSPTPPPRKRYSSRSRSRSKERDRDRDMRSPPPTPRRRSPSPPTPRRRSPSPVSRRQRPRDFRGQGRRRERSRSSSPPSGGTFTAPKNERSPSPPPASFLGSAYGKSGIEKLDESNKGHQMLKRMGWGGAGLGAKEQGIEAPISGGEVREREDLYKGVGVSLNDPYENFRKSKKQAFISRMKERQEDRP